MAGFGHSRTAVAALLVAMALLTASASALAGARTPAAEGGRRALGARVASGGDSEFGIATCFVNGDGSVRCWGDRAPITRRFGSLSNPFIPFNAPVLIDGISGAVAVALGDAHACALRSDGSVVCWGSNRSGQLGLGSVSSGSDDAFSTRDPALVPNLAGVVNLAAGGNDTCAVLSDGTARCWGDDSFGQLGNLTTSSSPFASPQLVQLSGGSALRGLVGITTDGGHTCALAATGTVFCWGSNNQGQIDGSPTVNVPQLVPKAVRVNVADVSAGPSYTCAVNADAGATASCWGSNVAAQLGAGTTDVHLTAISPVLGLTGAVAIAAATKHACALLANGTVSCWGSLGEGAVTGTPVFNTLQTAPAAVPNASAAVAVAGGDSVSCAALVDDGVRCWGNLGLTNPDVFNARIAGVASIAGRGLALGGAHTCARRAQGSVACWGENSLAQLGANSPTDQLLPVTAVQSAASAIAAGDRHGCARISNGTVRCWGDNASGQAGDTAGGVAGTPLTVADHFQLSFDPITHLITTTAVPLTSALSITAGASHTCSVVAGGAVKCWGSNGSGQLGNGSATDPSFPTVAVTAAISESALAVTAGNAHSCSLQRGGSVLCWGNNLFGQVTGTPSNTASLSPVSPSLPGTPFSAGAVAVAAGDFHTCAIAPGGTVTCWGSNGSGRLGDGSVTDAVAIAPGGVHTCALRVGGTVVCWGGNGSGQLGNGTFNPSTAPVTVQVQQGFRFTGTTIVPVFVDLTGIVSIESGNAHTCAVRNDGQPFCWGRNGSGQVGDGTNANNRTVATAVPSFVFNIDPAGTLAAHDRLAHLTALVNCPAGARVEVLVTVTQGSVSGQGIAGGTCQGHLARYDVTVPARGRNGFDPGSAGAQADGVVLQHGRVVTAEAWTRQVELSESN